MRGINGGIAHQIGFNGFKQAHQPTGLDQFQLPHRFDIAEVLRVTSFYFGKRLRVEVIVKKIYGTLLCDENAARTPIRQGWYEVVGTGQLQVYVQCILGACNGVENTGRFGIQLEIDINRCVSPSDNHRRGATDQVDSTLSLRFATQ